MNLLSGSLSSEMRRLLRRYVEREGLALGQVFFASHLREIQRLLIQEVERDVQLGRVKPKPVLKAG